jgi:Na+-driven multidrug efflux pump
MDLNQIKNNKLKMILGFSIPSIISMILTALITIIDGFLWVTILEKKPLQL